MRWMIIALGALAGCAPPVAPAGAARQQPFPTDPGPWTAHGRCLVDAGSIRASCRLVVVRRIDGTLHVALVADEGPLLLETDGPDILHAVPDLTRAAPLISHIARAAWGPAPGQPTWEETTAIAHRGEHTLTFGGDPLLLRRVTGGGPPVAIGDYRLRNGILQAHQALVDVPGVQVRLVLDPPLPTLAPGETSHP